MTVPDPYARTTIGGKPIDYATATALHVVEGKIGHEWTVYQGIGTADASASTHTEGRVVDLEPEDPETELPALKRAGFAVWHRRFRPGVWPAHYHACLMFGSAINPRGISAAAFAQIAEYLKGGDGLVGEWDDPDPWRPDPPAVFTLEEYATAYAAQHRTPRTNVQRARARIRAARGDLALAIARLDDVDTDRVVARGQIDDLRSERRHLAGILDALPDR
jgi:hypothetical protein